MPVIGNGNVSGPFSSAFFLDKAGFTCVCKQIIFNHPDMVPGKKVVASQFVSGFPGLAYKIVIENSQ